MSWLDTVRTDRPTSLNGLNGVRDPFDTAHWAPERGRSYAQSALADECDRVRRAPRPIPGVQGGGRNHQLFKSAANLAELVAGGEISHLEVVSALTAAARETGLPDAEIQRTMRSAWSRGSLNPRSRPAQLWTPTPRAGSPTETPTPDGTTAEAPVDPVEQWARRLEDALVDSAGLDDIPDPEPLIGNDIVFRDSLVWVVGKPGCMKSFTVLDMAGCVGTGEPWQGYPVHQGTVLYLVAEGVRGTKKRVRAWEKAMGHPMDGVHFLPVAVQSARATQWDALVRVAERLKPTMIVVDTQARVTVGVEENSNTEMGRFVDQAERLRQASGAAVIIVHHIGRAGETGRGATTLDGAMSTIIKVTKDEDQVKLECTKNKDGEQWADIDLRAVPMGESVVLVQSDGVKRAGEDGPSQAAMKMARSWWDSHGDKWASASSLVDVVAPKSTFFRHRQELERAGFVVANRDQRYPTFRLARNPYPAGEDPG